MGRSGFAIFRLLSTAPNSPQRRPLRLSPRLILAQTVQPFDSTYFFLCSALCVNSFLSFHCAALSIRKYYANHSNLVPHRNSI